MSGDPIAPGVDAVRAALDAHVDVRLLDDVPDLLAVDRIFSDVWGGHPQEAVSVHMMRALAHTDNYVAGAVRDGRIVGASVGFLANGGRSLHSHISGVDPRCQGKGIGFALKLHQREWCLAQGIRRVTWTFDPLIRRNAWFNLTKLGARAASYHVDFYGPMNDGINGGDPTDRCLVVWDLDELRRAPHPPHAAPLLEVGPAGQPVVLAAVGEPSVSVEVPADAVELRHRDPALGREWRLALRATLGRAMLDGYSVSGVTAEGRYVLGAVRT